MELWTEYEGRTIEGAFPLKKLLLPEGRSAFFSTSNGKGVPTVIRLIASHFDEDEILARWRGVEALGAPHILRLEKFGQLVLDDTTVVYAVIEPVDANLAEVIASQRLSIPEVRQLASSLASALEVLHSHGFVHEHVEASNVFAVGEIVKLRGDCIREAPEGEIGLQAKQNDVHDLAVVVLQALTQQSNLEAAKREASIPAPFDQIVRNGMNGSWGLADITAALQASERHAIPASAVISSVIAPPTAVGKPAVASPPINQTIEKPNPSPRSTPPPELKTAPLPFESAPGPGTFTPPSARKTFLEEDDDESHKSLFKTRSIAIAAAAALLLFWMVWHFAHKGSSAPTQSAQAAAPLPASTLAKPSPSSIAPVRPVARSANSPAPSTATHSQWRVVAFTYNRQDQAQKKAASVAQKHASLHPEVFTPTGRAPYLVTVGGAMSRDQAFAFVQKARNAGLPRDVYAQNYSGKR